MIKPKYTNLVIILIVFLLFIGTCSFAAIDTAGIKEYFSNPRGTLPSPHNAMNTLYGVFSALGYMAAVFAILVTGIKYLIGNPQQKAALKDKLWLIAIGILILVAGPTILKVVANIIDQINGT